MRAINPTTPPTTPPIMAGRLVLVLLDPVLFESAVGVDTVSDVATTTTPLGSVDVKVCVSVTGGRKLVDEDDVVLGVGVGVFGSSGLAVVVMVAVGLSGRVLGVGVLLLLLSHDVPNRV